MPLQVLKYTGTFRWNVFLRNLGSGVTEVSIFEVILCLSVAYFVTC
jgi:hypothetical protein